MKSNQTPLFWHVLYAWAGSTVLDVVHVSATGKFCHFVGCPIQTASQEDCPGSFPGWLQGHSPEFGGR